MFALILSLTIAHHTDTYRLDHSMTLHDCVTAMFRQRAYTAHHADVRIHLAYECVREK